MGGSFGLNNIPVNFAERIEVYRGVVPVGFGTDAIGGIINIVTPKRRRQWFVDASYSYGSFNTHKSYVNVGQALQNGFKYEINAFQNYSDNDYWIDSPVEDFVTARKKNMYTASMTHTITRRLLPNLDLQISRGPTECWWDSHTPTCIRKYRPVYVRR